MPIDKNIFAALFNLLNTIEDPSLAFYIPGKPAALTRLLDYTTPVENCRFTKLKDFPVKILQFSAYTTASMYSILYENIAKEDGPYVKKIHRAPVRRCSCGLSVCRPGVCREGKDSHAYSAA
ncbi:MAG: hypothetical protein LBI19_06265 [Oscillospiraceae bacterium]|jgi:hypothetical protein|nr:hypothetical protein [Oscillospiraceae bacterium]